MKEIGLQGILEPDSEAGYDEENPTKETELLAVSIRSFLSVLQDNSIRVRQSDNDDANTLASLVDAIAPVLSGGADYLEECREAFELENDLPDLPDIFAPESLSALVATLLPALSGGVVSLSTLIPVLLPHLIRFVVTALIPGFHKGNAGEINDIVSVLEEIRDNIAENTLQITAGYNSMADWIASLQETKQVGIMSTAEIDKVIWNRTI